MKRLMIRTVAAALILTAAPPISALELRDGERTSAANAFEQRIRCAAYYRYSFDLLERQPATLRSTKLMRTYRTVGHNMLAQASAMASAIGADRTTLTVRYKTAILDLGSRIDGKPERYNQLASQLHHLCLGLVVR